MKIQFQNLMGCNGGFDLPPGGVKLLIGPSGAGKSRLIDGVGVMRDLAHCVVRGQSNLERIRKIVPKPNLPGPILFRIQTELGTYQIQIEPGNVDRAGTYSGRSASFSRPVGYFNSFREKLQGVGPSPIRAESEWDGTLFNPQLLGQLETQTGPIRTLSDSFWNLLGVRFHIGSGFDSTWVSEYGTVHKNLKEESDLRGILPDLFCPDPSNWVGLARESSSAGVRDTLETLNWIVEAQEGSTLLIDDFGLRADPQIQIRLTNWLMARAESHQLAILLCTHSPAVVDLFDPDQILVIQGGRVQPLLDQHDRDWLAQARLGLLYQRGLIGGSDGA